MPCLTEVTSIRMDENIEAGTSNSCPESGLPMTVLRRSMLDYLLSNEKAHFKNQHKDDPELSSEEKRKIAEDLLDRSPAQFLGRFGQFLSEDHLLYFSEDAALSSSESYEIGFHLRRLQRFHCKATHNVDVKNRRYDALKKMIADGSSYFSEDEMRQRNPYLYEQLVGQYLSPEERKEREAPDLENITFVNLLLMKISKDETKELRTKQENEENGVENDSSESSEENEVDPCAAKNWNERGTWGEMKDDVSKLMDRRRKKKKKTRLAPVESTSDIPDDERHLLMQEFVSTMYNSFIDGKDADFDYSQIDSNPDYDCIDVREKDEEEKYFDSESPEDVEMEIVSDTIGLDSQLPAPPSLAEKRKAEEEEEDTLDAFMRTVEVPCQTSELASAFRNLCHQSAVQPQEKSRVKKPHVIKINLKKD